MTVLDTRSLNRATLARQLLLDRTAAPAVDVVTHLCGMQAQEPQEPFTGLWTRVRSFRPVDLNDRPDAPRPDPDTPAPVRFLPAFDNAILGYQDRTRIIDDAHRGLSVAGERVVLVDGRVRATWSRSDDALVVTPLSRLSPAERDAVDEEGRALASFLTDHADDRVRIEACSP
ncbi:DNA glycosylase AlkZ-like family protein [Streptomyces sp. NPDC097617]|uniref:DNA glycosylase AlkZ-like family protein n=1 Tax=Streptomyces sp. NPDC097617 TaxID=3366091 RepID=UPI003803D804